MSEKACRGHFCKNVIKHPKGSFTTQGMCSRCTKHNQRPYNWSKQGIRRCGKPFDYSDYDDLYAQQQGRCALCGQHFADDDDESKYSMAVDHDGDRPDAWNNVRALLCFECNTHRIGKFADDPLFLARAADYLRRYGAQDGRSAVPALANPPTLPEHPPEPRKDEV